jgi:hypothetical protein
MSKPNIEKIFLDMDGVIVNFEKRYEERYGGDTPKNQNEDIFTKNFRDFIKTKQFETLEHMPDAGELLKFLKFLNIPIEILSSTGHHDHHDEVSRQKRVWLRKHKINYEANFVPGYKFKKKFATMDSIIIDDHPGVIEGWNKCGGTGVLHTDALTTISILNMYI